MPYKGPSGKRQAKCRLRKLCKEFQAWKRLEWVHKPDINNTQKETTNIMQRPLNNYIEVGIVHFMAFPGVITGEGPILESLEKILGDDYFDLIEISWFKDPAVRAKAKEMFETSGIGVKYGAQPRLLTQKLNLNSSDEDERKKAVDEMKAAVDEASEGGITDLALLSGAYPGEEKKADAMDLLERSLNDICSYAGEREMNIVLEVFDRDIDKKCLIGPAADAREIAERVCPSHTNFGLMVDLSHIPLLGETPAEALRPVADFLTHIHIGNCYMDDKNDPAYGDMHPRFGYPGSPNDVDEITAYLKELFEVGYLKNDGSARAAISFEVKPVGDEDSELVIANAKRKLNEAWIKLQV